MSWWLFLSFLELYFQKLAPQNLRQSNVVGPLYEILIENIVCKFFKECCIFVAKLINIFISLFLFYLLHDVYFLVKSHFVININDFDSIKKVNK